jgi:hypothetical protein
MLYVNNCYGTRITIFLIMTIEYIISKEKEFAKYFMELVKIKIR